MNYCDKVVKFGLIYTRMCLRDNAIKSKCCSLLLDVGCSNLLVAGT